MRKLYIAILVIIYLQHMVIQNSHYARLNIASYGNEIQHTIRSNKNYCVFFAVFFFLFRKSWRRKLTVQLSFKYEVYEYNVESLMWFQK